MSLVRILPFLLLLILLANSTAQASDTQFSIPPGDSQTFFVTGDQPTITFTQGEGEFSSLLLPPNIWKVDIHCLASSQVDCEGTIHT